MLSSCTVLSTITGHHHLSSAQHYHRSLRHAKITTGLHFTSLLTARRHIETLRFVALFSVHLCSATTTTTMTPMMMMMCVFMRYNKMHVRHHHRGITTRYHPPNRLQMNETYQHPGSWEDTILVPTLTRSDPTHFIMSHVIRGLSPNSVYEVMIQARNVHGWNEVSCASLGSVCSRFCVNVKCVTSFLRVDPFGCLAAF